MTSKPGNHVVTVPRPGARLTSTDRLALLRGLTVDDNYSVPHEVVASMRWVIQSINTWLDSKGAVPFEVVLGLRFSGGISPARELALKERDNLLRALWRSHAEWSAMKPPAAARLMRGSASRYEQLQWKREQFRLDPPEIEPGATWWRCKRLGVELPKEKQLQRILNADIHNPL